jgi:lipopolysaccharide transport system ATP-binding protein
MKPVIEISGLSKKYRIRKTERYLSLRDTITGGIKNVFSAKKNDKEDFWALQDISLKIERGDRVGIIGRNGAGKSTLLKILSRITWPTSGEAIIRGRISSLLEVGTGFHPELSGRENIYLNGSILGLKRNEIEKQFDAIVDFSGVETFLDTPLKNYSSGMQLRLAFAVAAHLEPDILLVDEVLAVGDIEFQRKCIGKMEEVSKQNGRTILFVSHNINQVKNICTTGVLLENGRISAHDKIAAVIRQYSGSFSFSGKTQWIAPVSIGTKSYIKRAELKIYDELLTGAVDSKDQLSLEILLHASKTVANSLVAVRISNEDGIAIYTTTNADDGLRYSDITPGDHSYRIDLPNNILVPGRYSLIISWNIPYLLEISTITDALYFEVNNEQYPGEILKDGRAGILNSKASWKQI